MTSIKLKRSSTPSSAPRIEDLLLGELAVNTYDGIIYLKQQVGTTTSIISLQPLRASTIDGASIIGEIQNISALRFDTDSNFILTDLGNGAVKVSTQNLNPIDVGLVNSAFSYTNTVSNIDMPTVDGKYILTKTGTAFTYTELTVDSLIPDNTLNVIKLTNDANTMIYFD